MVNFHTDVWKNSTHINKILVPVDLTDASLCAVEAALTLSREKKSQIYLFHVVAAVEGHSGSDSVTGPHEADAGAQAKSRAMEEYFLKKVRPRSKFACIVRSGIPALEILTFAREEGVDVIVLHVEPGPNGGSPRSGGTSDRVIRNAGVPVMVVKPGTPVRKRTDTIPSKTEEEFIMHHDERYLLAIRERVCMKCIDRTTSGLCVASTYDACAINRYLPEIIDIVLATPDGGNEAYVARLREKVCSVCQHQSPDGRCDMRDDVECALDRYFPLVIEAIQEVKQGI